MQSNTPCKTNECLANEALVKASTLLDLIYFSQTIPSADMQQQVIELLRQASLLTETFENTTEVGTYTKAIRLLVSLLKDGQYGFTINTSLLQSFLHPENFYKLDANIDAMACAYQQEEKLVDIKSEKKVRVLFDNGMNFGNQAAGINLIANLRLRGFSGTIELIFPRGVHSKISLLLNLPINYLEQVTNKLDKKLAIRFIELNTFVRMREKNKHKLINLGFTAAIDVYTPEAYLKLEGAIKPASKGSSGRLALKNFANFLQVRSFVHLSPYYGGAPYDTRIQQRDNPYSIVQEKSVAQFIPTVVPTVEDAKHYLSEHPIGRQFSITRPDIHRLIAIIENKDINVLPMYGRSLYENPQNIANLIVAARHAQKNGPATFQKPLFVPIFMEQNNDVLKAVLTRLVSLESVSVLMSLDGVHSEHLRPGMICIYFTGHLPTILFNNLYAMKGQNIWPAVKEGANTLTLLLSTGKPHLHCKAQMQWEILSLANDPVKKQLEKLNQVACDTNAEMLTPENEKIISQYFIDAKNNTSAVSKFFRQLKKMSLDATQDRIQSALYAGLSVARQNHKQTMAILSPYLHRGFFGKSERTQAQLGGAITVEKQSFATPLPCVCPAEPSMAQRFFTRIGNSIADKLLAMGKEVSGTSYFPKDQPNLWRGQAPTLFSHADLGLNASAVPSLSYSNASLLTSK